MCDKRVCAADCNATAACAYGYDWSGTGAAPCGPCRRGAAACGVVGCTNAAPCAKCASSFGANYYGCASGGGGDGGCCGGQHPCSGCNVPLSYWNCQWCANSRASQQAYEFYNAAHTAAMRSGDPVVPPSGNPNFSVKGAWNPFGRPCYLNQPTAPIDVPGMHLCKVGEPNIWQYLPNWVPCGAAVNWYHNRDYINSVYDTTRTTPFCGPPCNPADPGYVQNAFTWPPPVPMNDTDASSALPPPLRAPPYPYT